MVAGVVAAMLGSDHLHLTEQYLDPSPIVEPARTTSTSAAGSGFYTYRLPRSG